VAPTLELRSDGGAEGAFPAPQLRQGSHSDARFRQTNNMAPKGTSTHNLAAIASRKDTDNRQ
jgi:hypothetical protein